MILAARGVLVDARTWVDGGALWIERGKIRRILRSRRAILRQSSAGNRVELEERVLTAGLVNAHTHLDLGRLGQRADAAPGFVSWVAAVVRERAHRAPREVEGIVRAGARELIAGGTTTVGDIDASGSTERLARTLGLGMVVYREVLDAWDPTRTSRALRCARARLPRSARVCGGLSPHAPYTTSATLLRGVAAQARRRGLGLAIHWAETREERDWLEAGRGPLATLLPASPLCSGLELLERAKLLSPRTMLVHGNSPRPCELELLARRGVTLVHCPGTHAFFVRPRFPLERYRGAGIPLALGTDSLASNECLDMRREMSLLRTSHPRLDPGVVFEMATEGGARALGLPVIGHLRPGAVADVVVWCLEAHSSEEVLEELTGSRPPVEGVFLAGREAKNVLA